jgi:hypothetical protein
MEHAGGARLRLIRTRKVDTVRQTNATALEYDSATSGYATL